GDPYFQSLAWELKARAQLLRNDHQTAVSLIEKALEIVERREVPIAAWRIHAAAQDIFEEHDRARATIHRKLARTQIMSLADSLDSQEPLRVSFLSASHVKNVLRQDDP